MRHDIDLDFARGRQAGIRAAEHRSGWASRIHRRDRRATERAARSLGLHHQPAD